ncbi:hypothetical protein ACO2FP_12880 [Staphylococcus warneri]
MPSTNLDKFYAIERIMEEFNGLKRRVFKIIRRALQYMNEYRREYRSLVRAINEIEKRLEITQKDDEEIEILKKNARINAQRHIEIIESKKIPILIMTLETVKKAKRTYTSFI